MPNSMFSTLHIATVREREGRDICLVAERLITTLQSNNTNGVKNPFKLINFAVRSPSKQFKFLHSFREGER